MAQYARPASTVSVSNLLSGRDAHTLIDEAVASDADSIASGNNMTAHGLYGLSAVTDPEVDTGHIVRYRYVNVNNGTPASGGSSSTLQVTLRHNGVDLASGTLHTVSGATWTDGTFTLSPGEASAIIDYSTLELRFDIVGGGGSPANRRGVAVSWAEFEVPDASAPAKSGTGAISQSSSATATGTKASAGAGAVSQASSVTATGRKDAGSAAAISQSSETAATGEITGPAASGTGEIVQTSATAATGERTGAGTGSVAQGSATAATGLSVRSGAAGISQASATAATGARSADGTAAIAQSHETTAAGQLGGEATAGITQASITSASGTRSSSGVAAIAQTSETTAVGEKEGGFPARSGTGSIDQASSTAAAGAKGVAGVAAIEQTIDTASTGEMNASFTAAISQPSTTSAAGSKSVPGAAAIELESSTTGTGSKAVSGTALISQPSTIEASAPEAHSGTASIVQASTVTAAGEATSALTTFGLLLAIASVLEPEAPLGVFGGPVISGADVDVSGEPFVYTPNVLHVWYSEDHRVAISPETTRQNFTIRAVYVVDSLNEEPQHRRRRDVSLALDTKRKEYLDRIDAAMVANAWDFIIGSSDWDATRSLEGRGFALVITGYRLLAIT